MSNENKTPVSVLQVICLAIGIFLGIVLVRTVLGLGGILGGALGGGLGALLGIVIFGVISRFK
ncbi:MAG: hypothetical protein R2681_07235 [Pyrinomonadaceae bacterium]